MRAKFKSQQEMDFTPSNLKVTNEYYGKYERISQVLNENPQLVEALHRDVAKVFGGGKRGEGGRDYAFSSDTVLRILIVKQVEGMDYRETVVRIDDSYFLRQFVGILNGKMMDFTTLCKMYKAIRPRTWKKINDLLTHYALATEQISGEQLRRDTTVYQANIHYPTDSSLLWDSYRVLGRFIEKVREIDPPLVGQQRLRTRDVKRIYFQINRQVGKRSDADKELKTAYAALIQLVETILIWADQVCDTIRTMHTDYTWELDVQLLALVKEYEPYIARGVRVLDQASRRVLEGQQVPNQQKLFSIFEPHVELIKRGKAGKDIEFGHMVNFQQVKEKFITGYDVFERKPVEHELVDPSLAQHQAIFGAYPQVYADDKGAYQSMEKLYQLEEKIAVVGIAKKGTRNRQEQAREHAPAFKLAQKFRAGIEGSISFLKRALGLGKCLYRSFATFKASVGSIVFAHNLLILARL